MSRNGWIVTLIVVGVLIAVGVAYASNSQSVQQEQFCSSVAGFQSDIAALQAVDPATATTGEIQTDVGALQSSWSSVKSNGQDLADVDMNALEGAWNSFQSSAQSATGSGTPSETMQAMSSQLSTLQQQATASAESAGCSSSTSSS